MNNSFQTPAINLDTLRLLVQIGQAAEKQLSDLTIKPILTWENLESTFNNKVFPPISVSSQRDYSGWIRALTKWSISSDIAAPSALTRSFCENYAQSLFSEGISPARRFRFFRRVWRTCQLDPTIWETPGALLTGQHEHYRRLTLPEIKLLTSTAQAADPVLSDIIQIGYWTGLRLSDVVQLERAEIVISKRALRIVPNKVKTRKPYPLEIPLVGDAFDIIARRLRNCTNTNFLFAPRYHHHLSRRLKRIFERCHLHKSGIDRTSFHSLRATFISMMDEAGIPPYITDSITGHASGGMHARYSQPLLSCKRQAIKKALKPLH